MILIKKIIRRLENYESSYKFIRFCEKNFGKKEINYKNNILFEFNSLSSAIVCYAYLSNVLSKKYNSNIIAYNPYLISFIKLPYLVIKDYLSLNYKVWKSFGVKKIIYPKLNSDQISEAEKITNKIYEKINCKQDILNIKIENVWIGDLIYDSYLRENMLPTININSLSFKKFLNKSVKLYVFWRDYIINNNVVAINVSHTSYNFAIPLRIAVKLGIKVFQINAQGFYQLDKNNLTAYKKEFIYPKVFRNFSNEAKINSLKKAEDRLKKRFSGEVGVDMFYSTKSGFEKVKDKRVLKQNNKLKVLIAAHCFFDNPHGLGLGIFPDFYEWFEFLCKKTNTSKYDWYVKSHPDFFPKNKDVLASFVNKYPKLSLLEADTSHHQLIKEGINVALTVFGTIGVEYAALGIPVINASLDNPHVAYDFNINPKNIEEYNSYIDNLENLKLIINKDKVYEYYFMNNLYDDFNLFFDYRKMESELEGYMNQFNPNFFSYWLNQKDNIDDKIIESKISYFIDTNNYYLNNSNSNEKIL